MHGLATLWPTGWIWPTEPLDLTCGCRASVAGGGASLCLWPKLDHSSPQSEKVADHWPSIQDTYQACGILRFQSLLQSQPYTSVEYSDYQAACYSPCCHHPATPPCDSSLNPHLWTLLPVRGPIPHSGFWWVVAVGWGWGCCSWSSPEQPIKTPYVAPGAK